MAKMSAVYMDICDMYTDGMDESEIAEVLSLQYDIDLDFAYNLIDEVLDAEDLYGN
jgi:hypothetical protein